MQKFPSVPTALKLNVTPPPEKNPSYGLDEVVCRI